MKVVIGPFALWGIKAHLGSNVGAGIETAMTHYARRLRSETPPRDIPQFGLEDHIEDDQDEQSRVFHLAVDADTESAIAQEARRQGVSIDRLVDHTIMVFLADMERAELDPSHS